MGYEEISSGFPKARKEHSCEWCAETILVGEKHFQRTYKFCGDFNNGRMHMECFEDYENTDSYYLEDGWTPGAFERPKSNPPAKG